MELLVVEQCALEKMRPEEQLAALNAAVQAYAGYLEPDPASTPEMPRPQRPRAGVEQAAEAALGIAQAWLDVLSATHRMGFGGSSGWSFLDAPPEGNRRGAG